MKVQTEKVYDDAHGAVLWVFVAGKKIGLLRRWHDLHVAVVTNSDKPRNTEFQRNTQEQAISALLKASGIAAA